MLLGMFQQSWDLLESLPDGEKRSRRVQVMHLDILTGLKEWPKAALLAQSLCQVDPGDLEMHLRAGRYLCSAGNFQGALDWFQEHRDRCAKNAFFHYEMARIHAVLGDLKAARESVKTTVALDASLRLKILDDPRVRIHQPWLGRYDPEWEGELLIWPPYDVGAVAKGRLSSREGQQIRANYGAKLSMIDYWVGEVFAALGERGLWDSTAVIVCTETLPLTSSNPALQLVTERRSTKLPAPATLIAVPPPRPAVL